MFDDEKSLLVMGTLGESGSIVSNGHLQEGMVIVGWHASFDVGNLGALPLILFSEIFPAGDTLK